MGLNQYPEFNTTIWKRNYCRKLQVFQCLNWKLFTFCMWNCNWYICWCCIRLGYCECHDFNQPIFGREQCSSYKTHMLTSFHEGNLRRWYKKKFSNCLLFIFVEFFFKGENFLTVLYLLTRIYCCLLCCVWLIV